MVLQKLIKHSALSSDGGFLETTVTGMTDLSNGSLIMGNASNIQTEIAPGNNLDVLTMGVTLPAWTAPVSSASFELVDDQELTGTATYMDSTFTSISGSDVAQLQVVLDLQRSNVGTCNILMQYGSSGSLVTSSYYTSYTGTSIASGFYNNQAEWLIALNPNYRHLMTNAFISVPDPDMTTFNADMVMFSNSSNTNPEGYIVAGTRDGTENSIDQIRVSVSAGNLEIGSKMSIYRLNR